MSPPRSRSGSEDCGPAVCLSCGARHETAVWGWSGQRFNIAIPAGSDVYECAECMAWVRSAP